jgi:hypothetical protein
MGLSCLLTLAQPAFAEAAGDQAEYEALVDRAVDAFEAGDFERAHDQFHKAFALRPNARVRRGLGIAALRLARYSEAKQQLSAALTDTNQALNAKQRDEVSRLLAWIGTNLGSVHVYVTPRVDQIAVDGQPVEGTELVLTPGIHRIRASAAGYAAQERTVDLAAAQEDTLTLTLASDLPSPARVAAAAPVIASTPHEAPAPVMINPSARAPIADSPSLVERWWFWTAVAVVVAGGAVAGGVALANRPSTKAGTDEPGTKLLLLRQGP